MLKLKPNLFPGNGGYAFRDSDGTQFTGPNWNAVVKKVKEYRIRRRVAVGDVVAEVTQQACQKNPGICFDDTGRPAPKQALSLKSKALKWLNGFAELIDKGEKLAFVGPTEAKARAMTCAGCPFNVNMGVSACASCKQSFVEFRKTILGGSRVQDERLKGCGALAVDLKVAAHLDELRIDDPNLPANCWRKKAL